MLPLVCYASRGSRFLCPLRNGPQARTAVIRASASSGKRFIALHEGRIDGSILPESVLKLESNSSPLFVMDKIAFQKFSNEWNSTRLRVLWREHSPRRSSKKKPAFAGNAAHDTKQGIGRSPVCTRQKNVRSGEEIVRAPPGAAPKRAYAGRTATSDHDQEAMLERAHETRIQ